MTRLVARLALVPVAAALVLIGIWVAGGVVTNDFRAAMALTAAWLVLAGVAAPRSRDGGGSWRSRCWAVS